MCNKYYITRNFKIISKMKLSIPILIQSTIILDNPRNVPDRISSLNDRTRRQLMNA